MGVGVSTNVSEATSSVLTTSVNKCKKGAASNELYLSGVTHDPSPGCKTSSFNISQSAVVDADCFINALQNNLVENVSKLTADAQAGIGVAVANNTSVNKQELNTKLENICAGASSTNMVSAKDITSHACDMTFVQNASAKTKCKIDALQDAVVKSETALASTATGASLGSLLFGGGIGGAVGGIVIVLLLVAAAYAYYRYKTGGVSAVSDIIRPRYRRPAPVIDEQTDASPDAQDEQVGGDFNLFNKKNYPVVIIITLLILVGIFMAYSRTPNAQLTASDLDNFQSKLFEAKKIANLETSTSTSTVSDIVNEQILPPYQNYRSSIVHNYESDQVQKQNLLPVQMVYQNPSDIFEQPYMIGPVYYNDLDSYYNPLI